MNLVDKYRDQETKRNLNRALDDYMFEYGGVTANPAVDDYINQMKNYKEQLRIQLEEQRAREARLQSFYDDLRTTII
jgi:hypothetical protein